MSLNLSNGQRAEVLTQALPYIKKYYGEIIVVKYGGNAMINDDLKQHVMEDIVLLSLVGVKVVLVHGGGPEISQTLDRLGIETKFVDGLRVTDRETADVVQMVLAGRINKSLVNYIEVIGGRAIGLSGIDGQMIKAEMKDERLGYVGRITQIDATPVTDLLDRGYIPVISTVACDDAGNVYNVNADTAAAGIAAAIKAKRLVTLTDIAGILHDKDDPGSLISRLEVDSARKLMDEGVISGGMIPKLECCINAVEAGVECVVVLDGRIPHAILLETLTDEGAGTMVYKEKKI